MEIHEHRSLLLGGFYWEDSPRILRDILCLSMSASEPLVIGPKHWPQTWRRAKIFDPQQTPGGDYKYSDLVNIGIETRVKTRIEKMFDPQQTPGGDYKYSGKVPNGYYEQVEHNSLFQDFDTKYLVLRLWADPRFPDSFIRAHQTRLNAKYELYVSFIRQGWGCDVTIQQENNKT